MRKNRTEVIEYINGLKGYRGYVQFSHRPLKQKDIFEESDPQIDIEKKGFIYEAHFCNAKQSIMIRQINNEWLVSTTDISKAKEIEFYVLEKTKHLENIKSNWIKMAQIWEEKPDELCEGMGVMKLQKVVFAGFEKERA